MIGLSSSGRAGMWCRCGSGLRQFLNVRGPRSRYARLRQLVMAPRSLSVTDVSPFRFHRPTLLPSSSPCLLDCTGQRLHVPSAGIASSLFCVRLPVFSYAPVSDTACSCQISPVLLTDACVGLSACADPPPVTSQPVLTYLRPVLSRGLSVRCPVSSPACSRVYFLYL